MATSKKATSPAKKTTTKKATADSGRIMHTPATKKVAASKPQKELKVETPAATPAPITRTGPKGEY